jgi:hypothetical protein
MPLLQHLVSFPDPRGHADKNFMSSPSHARLLFCNFPLQIPLTNFIEFDRKLSNLAFSIATSRGNPSQVVFRHFPHSKKKPLIFASELLQLIILVLVICRCPLIEKKKTIELNQHQLKH